MARLFSLRLRSPASQDSESAFLSPAKRCFLASAPYSHAIHGVVVDGTVSDGTVSDGTVSDGTVSDGTVSDGTVSDGIVTCRHNKMDTPEQPTVWPPAPTIAPPKMEDQPKFAIFLPAWLAYVLKESALPGAVVIGMLTVGSLMNHRPLPSWKDYMIVIGVLLTMNGVTYCVKTRWKRTKSGL